MFCVSRLLRSLPQRPWAHCKASGGRATGAGCVFSDTASLLGLEALGWNVGVLRLHRTIPPPARVSCSAYQRRRGMGLDSETWLSPRLHRSQRGNIRGSEDGPSDSLSVALRVFACFIPVRSWYCPTLHEYFQTHCHSAHQIWFELSSISSFFSSPFPSQPLSSWRHQD